MCFIGTVQFFWWDVGSKINIHDAWRYDLLMLMTHDYENWSCLLHENDSNKKNNLQYIYMKLPLNCSSYCNVWRFMILAKEAWGHRMYHIIMNIYELQLKYTTCECVIYNLHLNLFRSLFTTRCGAAAALRRWKWPGWLCFTAQGTHRWDCGLGAGHGHQASDLNQNVKTSIYRHL